MQKTKTVLVVDDDSDFRSVTRLAFEQKQYRVLEAGNGADGVALAITEKPDVIVLDVILPDMRCSHILRELLKNPSTRHTPVIVVSNCSEPDKISEVISSGATSYVLKIDHTPSEIFQLADKLTVVNAPVAVAA